MLKVRAKNKQPCCPLCRVELSEMQTYTCSSCETEYHYDCAEELGGCGTIGCARMGIKPNVPTPDAQNWRARARRRTTANRQRRTSGRRLRARHVEEGSETSRWSWFPAMLEGLFYVLWIILEIVLS